MDCNATTLPFPEVLQELQLSSQVAFANPGSPHAAGSIAKETYWRARTQIAEHLDADARQVIFTSGGTEAINMALIGRARKTPPATIRFQVGDHPATTVCANHLCQAGWSQEQFEVDESGAVDFHAAQRLSWHPNDIATFLLAHNETGVIQNAEALSDLICKLRELGVWTHIDAVQAVGKIAVSFRQLAADSMSIASHKFHGPRGVGALLLRQRGEPESPVGANRSSPIEPLIFGGGQEDGLRPGTQCVPLAAAMSKALGMCLEDPNRKIRIASMRDRFEEMLAQRASEIGVAIKVHGNSTERLPNTSFVSFLGFTSQPLLKRFIDSGVQCSAGAACKSDQSDKETGSGSAILTAMGCAQEAAISPIRFSIDESLSNDLIDDAVSRIVNVLQMDK